MKNPSLYDSRKILNLPIGAVRPNPDQPRREFDDDSLSELSDSIMRYGVLQPLTVRRLPSGVFELVAGERRLRASKLAGLKSVPCVLLDIDSEQSGLIALVENLQRRDLDYIEEARGLSTLIKKYSLSQEEAARRLSKSQSAVANKLRLLRLSPDILSVLRKARLSERHARALLRLPDEKAQAEVLEHVIRNQLNVVNTEAYIDQYLARAAQPAEEAAAVKKVQKKTPYFVIKDVRIFLNTLTRSLGIMKRSGIDAELEHSETQDGLVLTITIPHTAST